MKTTFRIMLLALLLAMLSLAHAVTVQVGEEDGSTSSFPVYSNGKYCYTQQIFTQAQINSVGAISKIRFYYQTGTVSNNTMWTIYLGHTQRTSFADQTDWEPVANLTQVFEGDVEDMFPVTVNKWMEVAFDTPFNYNNTDNLIVAVYQHIPEVSMYSYINWGRFNAGVQRGLYVHSENEITPYFEGSSLSGYVSTYLSIIQLVFPDTQAPLAPLLTEPAQQANVVNGQSLRWTLPAGSADTSGYDLYINGNLVGDNLKVPCYKLNDLQPGTYTWYVVARNSIGSSNPSDTKVFNMHPGTTVGDGKTIHLYPFRAHRNQSCSLGLYTFNEIRYFGTITHLGWNVHTPSDRAVTYQIYAKKTFDTTQTRMLWEDFEPTATLVTQGVAVFNTPGWHQIALNTPIAYTQGNLLIGVKVYPGNFNDNGAFFFQSPCAEGFYQTWYSYNGPPGYTGYMNEIRPNIMFRVAPLSQSPLLVVGPPEWNIGSTVVNAVKTQTFNIANAGTGTVTVTGLSPMSDGFFTVTDAPTFPLELTPGNPSSFTIQYYPTAGGTHTATFTLTDGRSTTDINVSAECVDNSITGFPYLQNFDGEWTGTPAAPEGWTVINVHNNRYTWRQDACWNAAVHSPPYCAQGAGNYDDWLITPPINLSDANVRMKWWDLTDSELKPNSYKVLVSTTSPYIECFTTELADITCANPFWTEHVLSLHEYTGQTIFIAFHQYYSNTEYGGFGVDDFLLEELSPVPEMTLTSSHLDFAPGFIGTPSAYQDLVITNSGFGTLELTAANVSIIGSDAGLFEFDPESLPLSLGTYQSGAIPVRYNSNVEGAHNAILRLVYNGENYDVELNAIGLGPDALFESFEGSMFPPAGWGIHNGGYHNTWFRSTTSPNSGAAHAQIRHYYECHDDWLITPLLTPSATNHRFNFFGRNRFYHCDNRFNVLVSTTEANIESFTHIIASNVSTGKLGYMFHSFDLSEYIGQPIHVAIQAISQNQWDLYIDDITGPDHELAPPVAPVLIEPVNAAAMAPHVPTLVWSPNVGTIPIGYKVYCDTNNPPTTEVADVSTTSFTLTTVLDFGTTYFWRVRGYNEAGLGEASAVYHFTTSPTDMVVIGAGTAHQEHPFCMNLGYVQSAALYTADLIARAPGMINFIGWDCAFTGVIEVPYQIYLKNTTITEIPEETWDNFRVGLNLVKEGVYDFASTGWHTISLDTPFNYTGDNLIVVVATTYGYEGHPTMKRFRYTTAPGMHGTWASDYGVAYNQICHVNSNRPNVVLGFRNDIGMISGHVTGFGYEPLSDVQVTLEELQYTTRTDAAGYYQIRNIPAGSYFLTFSRSDYCPYAQAVTVEAGGNLVIDVEMWYVDNDDATPPTQVTALNGNYPNPFNPETTISYSVNKPGRVKLEVYNIKGQLVRTLIDSDHASGEYKQVFNAKDNRGRSISSGVYLLRMVAPGYQKTSKMILMQ